MIKKTLKYLFIVIIIITATVFLLNYWITSKTRSYIYHNYEDIPHHSIGLVLGTSKYIKGGGINAFYKNRIDGAIQLYQLGKVDYLLLSGDNALFSYNEPITMRKDLLKAGIPDSAIVLDYAGFRTLDSVIRANKVFDANNFTIITQQFHCERALFIAQYQGIDATCFAVPTPNNIQVVKIRELFARISALIDLYILDKEPKFLGPLLPIIPDEQNSLPLENENNHDNSTILHQ